MKTKSHQKMSLNQFDLDPSLGMVIAISGIQYNPTHEWINQVYQFRIDQYRDRITTPHYGGSEIQAVLMEAKLEFADPKTEFCIAYKYIRWPCDTTVLRVFELEDGTLWEQLTDTLPVSIDPGQSIIQGKSWKEDWLLSSKAQACEKLIGSHVTRLHFLKELSGEALELHKSRLLNYREK